MGADLIYFGVFDLLGPRIWTPNLIVLALGLALCALCLRIAKALMPRAQAALATTLYLVFVIGLTRDGTHHWFSMLAVMCAVAILMGGRAPVRIAIAGALLGVATFITQTRGPAAALGIAGWLTWERLRTRQPWSAFLKRLGWLFAPLILTWTALSGYYIVTRGVPELWHFQVSYVLEYMLSAWHSVSFALPDGSPIAARLLHLVRSLFAYAVLPFVYAISLWRCWREPPSNSKARLVLLAMVGTALFVEVARSPSWFRIYCVCLPGVILLVWLAGRIGKLAACFQPALWISVLSLAAYQIRSMHVHDSVIIDLPAGRVATSSVTAEKLVWLAARTQPGQFMLQADWPGLYLPLALRNPLFLDTFPDGSGPTGEAASSLYELNRKRVQYIVTAPRLQAPESASLPLLHQFLVSHYRLIWTFSDADEVWERRQ